VDAVYVQLLALGFIATLLVGSSAWKFRGQMSWSFSAAELLGEGQVGREARHMCPDPTTGAEKQVTT